MKALSVVGEAWRNLTSGTARAVLLATVFVFTVGSLAVVDVRSQVGILQAAVRFREAAGSVLVLDGSPASGQRCDAISGIGGVQAAGAARPGDSLVIHAMPGSSIKVIEVTPGLLAMLPAIAKPISNDPDVEGGVWLSEDLADTLGVTPGDTVSTSAGAAVVAGVYTWPSDGRSRDLGYAMLAQVPPDGEFTQCFALIWPPDQDGGELLRMVSVPASGGEPSVSQLNSTLGSSFNVTELLADRLERHVPWVGTAIAFVVGYAAVRVRRLEVASALHARVAKPHLAWQLLLETVAWVGWASVIAAGVALWAAREGNPDPSLVTWLAGLRTVTAGSVATVLGGLTAVAFIKERHLFLYSKDR